MCGAPASLIAILQAIPTPSARKEDTPCAVRISRSGEGEQQRWGKARSTLYLKSLLAQVGHQGIGVGLAGSRHELVVPCRLQETLHIQVEASLPPRPLWLVALRDNLCAASLTCLCASRRVTSLYELCYILIMPQRKPNIVMLVVILTIILLSNSKLAWYAHSTC